MPRRVLVVVLALLLSPLVVAVPGAGPALAATAAETSYAARTKTDVDRQRTRRALPALRADRCLRKVALRQAQRMARERQLSHTDPFGAILRRCRLSVAGENVAYNGGGPRATTGLWMASPGHRANILDRRYRLTGVAAVRRHGVWWVAQVFGRR
ncbi:CAP domain-containing protein [Nocardioides litoris]|uniref:CAP domain-containing protein n=1 Tax=Nocardioides litoris TaxID=1926648 RepID=UPI00147737F7|nr:CAP domain-containing protein [Nocardioides litoris]